MDFISTYRKDFKWPLLDTQRKSGSLNETGLAGAGPCLEGKAELAEGNKELAEGNKELAKGSESQQTGSTYLEKLFKKYPYLNNVMKYTNPEEMVKKILHEKYKTTYQVEYNKEDFHPANNFKEMMDVVETAEKMKSEEEDMVGCVSVAGPPPEKCSCGLTLVPCKCAKDAPLRKVAWRPALVSKIPQAPREKRRQKKDDEEKAEKAAGEAGKQKLKPFCSEYDDTIGKIGGIIIKRKLLHKIVEESYEGKQKK